MNRIIAKNPTAFHNYTIEDRFEAGIVLSGTEIKSIRNGNVNIKDSYIIIKNGEMWIKKEQIKGKMNEYMVSRKEKQPIEFYSAGSTFKRGSNFITAKIIDECGLKGYRIGNAEVSKKHAGFVVNLGDATAKDVIDVVEYVKKIM